MFNNKDFFFNFMVIYSLATSKDSGEDEIIR